VTERAADRKLAPVFPPERGHYARRQRGHGPVLRAGSPARVGLVPDAQQKEDNNQAQWDTKQPEQNEDHRSLLPVALDRLRGTTVTPPVVRERHWFARCHPPPDHFPTRPSSNAGNAPTAPFRAAAAAFGSVSGGVDVAHAGIPARPLYQPPK
jgi:hypothetical protein